MQLGLKTRAGCSWHTQDCIYLYAVRDKAKTESKLVNVKYISSVLLIVYQGADKALAQPGRKQATATKP